MHDRCNPVRIPRETHSHPLDRQYFKPTLQPIMAEAFSADLLH
jgi:hypothetical protein